MVDNAIQPKMIRLLALVVSLMLLVSANPLWASKPDEPSVMIQSLFAELNERLQADSETIKEDQSHLLEVGQSVLVPYVAFDRMAQRILGKHWNSITEDEQQRYTEAFKNRVSVTMASQYDPSSDYTLSVLGERRNERGNQAIVRTEIVEVDSGKRYTLDYSLLFSKSAQRWLIYDVAVEGVSILQSFRTATAEDFGRRGIEYLIKQLEQGETG